VIKISVKLNALSKCDKSRAEVGAINENGFNSDAVKMIPDRSCLRSEIRKRQEPVDNPTRVSQFIDNGR